MREGPPQKLEEKEMWEVDPHYVATRSLKKEQPCVACEQPIEEGNPAMKVILRKKGWKEVSKNERQKQEWQQQLYYHVPGCFQKRFPRSKSDFGSGEDAFYKKLPGSFEGGKRR